MRKKLSPDFQLRQKLKHILITKIALKTIQRSSRDVFLPVMHRHITKAYYKFPKFGKIHDFCSVTGRGRSIIHKFRLSRNMFKQHSNYGLLYCIRKASW